MVKLSNLKSYIELANSILLFLLMATLLVLTVEFTDFIRHTEVEVIEEGE